MSQYVIARNGEAPQALSNVEIACRKRRIKCGEERPTCANCIKSKRGCEGYAPRLTFKDPLSAFRPGWAMKGTGVHYQTLSAQNGATGQYGRPQTGSGTQTQLPVIAPRLPPQQVPSDYYSPAKSTTVNWPGDSYSSYANGFGGPNPVSDHLPPRMRQVYQRQNNPSSGPLHTSSVVPTTSEVIRPGPPPTLKTHYTSGSSEGIDIPHSGASPGWLRNFVPSALPKHAVEPPNRHLDLANGQILPNNQVELASQSMLSQGFDMVSDGSTLPGDLYNSGIYEQGSYDLRPSTNMPSVTIDSYQATNAHAWNGENGHQNQGMSSLLSVS